LTFSNSYVGIDQDATIVDHGCQILWRFSRQVCLEFINPGAKCARSAFDRRCNLERR
jgi:hypothetical protein